MDRGQLPLAFPHDPVLTDSEFLPGPGNRLALEFLRNTGNWPGARLALWGPAGSGKTHLLHIWAREHGAGILSGPRLTEPLWPEGAIAVDDIDLIASEAALLYLLNAAAEANRPVLLTASVAPGRIPVGLPDLASRLRAVTAVEIGPADDAFRAALLARLLAARQLPVSPALQAWMLTRLPRTERALHDVVVRLDRAALAAGSAVTRPLAAKVLADLYGEELSPAGPAVR